MLVFSHDLDATCSPGRGPRQYARLCAELGKIQPRTRGGGSRPAACARALSTSQSVFMISDFLAEDGFTAALASLATRQQALRLIQLRDPADTRLPTSPELQLVDIEDGSRRPAGHPGRAEEAAAGRMAALESLLRDWSNNRGAAFTACDCDSHWRDAVLAHFTGS